MNHHKRKKISAPQNLFQNSCTTTLHARLSSLIKDFYKGASKRPYRVESMRYMIQFCHELHPLLSDLVLELKSTYEKKNSTSEIQFLHTQEVTHFHVHRRKRKIVSTRTQNALISMYDFLDSIIKQVQAATKVNQKRLEAARFKRRKKRLKKRLASGKNNGEPKLSVLLEETECFTCESFNDREYILKSKDARGSINVKVLQKEAGYLCYSNKPHESAAIPEERSQLRLPKEDAINIEIFPLPSNDIKIDEEVKQSERNVTTNLTQPSLTTSKSINKILTETTCRTNFLDVKSVASLTCVLNSKNKILDVNGLKRIKSEPLNLINENVFEDISFSNFHFHQKGKPNIKKVSIVDTSKNDKLCLHHVEGNTLMLHKELNILDSLYYTVSKPLKCDMVEAETHVNNSGDCAEAHNEKSSYFQKSKKNKIIISLTKINKLIKCTSPAECCKTRRKKKYSKFSLPYVVSAKSLPLDEEDFIMINKYIQNKKKNEKESKCTKRQLSYFIHLNSKDNPKSSLLKLQKFDVRYFDYEKNPRENRRGLGGNPEDRPQRRRSKYYDYPDEVTPTAAVRMTLNPQEQRPSIPLSERDWAPLNVSDISLPREYNKRKGDQQRQIERSNRTADTANKKISAKISTQTSSSDLKSLAKISSQKPVQNSQNAPTLMLAQFPFAIAIPQNANFDRVGNIENTTGASTFPVALKHLNASQKENLYDNTAKQFYGGAYQRPSTSRRYPIGSNVQHRSTNTEDAFQMKTYRTTVDGSCQCNFETEVVHLNKQCVACISKSVYKKLNKCCCSDGHHNCGK